VAWSSSDTAIATVSEAGIVIAGRREGTVRIRARIGGIDGLRAVTVRARVSRDTESAEGGEEPGLGDLPAAAGPWTFCANTGANCEFLGLREVRLLYENGSTAQQAFYGLVPCSIDSFGDQNPSGGRALRCEYGPMRRRVIDNPMPGAFGMGVTAIVPAGSAGLSEERMRPATAAAHTSDGSGTFRTRCDPTDFQFNDPLGNPARANASPLHVFFGNTTVGSSANAATVATTGNSTCRGGVLDRSVYYVPALIDSRNGEVQVPTDAVIYFRTGYNVEPVTIQPVPAGLVLVAGDRNARGTQPRVVEWLCRDKFVTNTGMIPDCGVGDQVQLWVHFPQCWDGRNLDSRDHRSHMAYAIIRNGGERSTCPTSHPVPVPQVSQLILYNVRAGASLGSWRLSTDAYGARLRGGLSAHAHWINGWNPQTLRAFVSECLNRALDCNNSSLGNATAIY
jgi:hypothetical protein